MKIKAIFATILAAGLILFAAPMAANASEGMRFTHPQVTGTATCDTTTGGFNLVWSISADPGYPDVTGVFVSTDRPSIDGQIVGQVSKGGQIVQATETNLPAGTYTLDVGIQFDNHKDGDIVHNSGQIVADGECSIPVEPTYPTLSYTETSCEGDVLVGENSFSVVGAPGYYWRVGYTHENGEYLNLGDNESWSDTVPADTYTFTSYLIATDEVYSTEIVTLGEVVTCDIATPPPIPHGPQLAATGPADDQLNLKLGFAAALLVLVGLALAGLGALGRRKHG